MKEREDERKVEIEGKRKRHRRIHEPLKQAGREVY